MLNICLLASLALVSRVGSTLVLGTEKLYSSDSASDSASYPAQDTEQRGFWLTTEVVSVEFRKGCLSTALCHEPKFKLVNKMSLTGEEFVMSWPASGDSIKVCWWCSSLHRWVQVAKSHGN